MLELGVVEAIFQRSIMGLCGEMRIFSNYTSTKYVFELQKIFVSSRFDSTRFHVNECNQANSGLGIYIRLN